MRVAVLIYLGWVLACIPPRPADGRDLYVSNTAGDDGAGGLTPKAGAERNGPVRTIGMALRIAHQGDRIVVANTGQPYYESLTLEGSQHSGFSFNRFTIVGNGAILDGTTAVPSDAWESYRGPMFRFRPPRMQFQQLFLNDRPLPQVVAGQQSDSPPRLEPLQWCLHRGWIYFCIEPGKLPDEYRLSYSDKDVGITLYHVERVQISDLVVQGFRIDGINAFNSARDVNLVRTTARGNGRSGIAAGGASTVTLDSALVGNNGRAQVLSQPLSELHVEKSELLSNTAPAVVDEGGRVFVDGKPVLGGIDERKVKP